MGESIPFPKSTSLQAESKTGIYSVWTLGSGLRLDSSFAALAFSVAANYASLRRSRFSSYSLYKRLIIDGSRLSRFPSSCVVMFAHSRARYTNYRLACAQSFRLPEPTNSSSAGPCLLDTTASNRSKLALGPLGSTSLSFAFDATFSTKASPPRNL